MEQVVHKQEKIKSITGLKAVAMILIFIFHSRISFPAVDLGARMCELFFLLSGFLVGYKYLTDNKRNENPTWRDSIDYLKKKLKAVLPVHIVSATVVLLVLTRPLFSGHTLLRFILNVLLLHAWSTNREVFFSFNGATWFLSALMFCYFLSPFLSSTLNNKSRKLIIIFALVVILRVGFELLQVHFPGRYTAVPIYVFPPIRALEFYLGMLVVPLYLKIREYVNKRYDKKRKLYISSIAEMLVLAAVSYLCFRFNTEWIRGYFVLTFLPLLLVFAMDAGVISKLLSTKPLMWFGKYQLTFFIIHQVVIRLFYHCFATGIFDDGLDSAMIFVVVIALAVGYQKLEGKIRVMIANRKQKKESSRTV